MTKNNNLLYTINNVDKLTQSQEDRLNKTTRIEENLFNFLDTYLINVNDRKSPYKIVWDAIKERIDDEGSMEDVPWAVLVKLLEITAKMENESAIPILNMIKDIQINNANANKDIEENGGREKENESNGLTKEEMDKYKRLDKFMNKTKKSEFPEEN